MSTEKAIPRILVVDDCAVTCDLLTAILSAEGIASPPPTTALAVWPPPGTARTISPSWICTCPTCPASSWPTCSSPRPLFSR